MSTEWCTVAYRLHCTLSIQFSRSVQTCLTSHRIQNFYLAKCHSLNIPQRASTDSLMFRYDGSAGGQDQQSPGGGIGGGGVPGSGPHFSPQYNARPGKTK